MVTARTAPWRIVKKKGSGHDCRRLDRFAPREKPDIFELRGPGGVRLDYTAEEAPGVRKALPSSSRQHLVDSAKEKVALIDAATPDAVAAWKADNPGWASIRHKEQRRFTAK